MPEEHKHEYRQTGVVLTFECRECPRRHSKIISFDEDMRVLTGWYRKDEKENEMTIEHREHVTNGGPCWCNPTVEHVPAKGKKGRSKDVTMRKVFDELPEVKKDTVYFLTGTLVEEKYKAMFKDLSPDEKKTVQLIFANAVNELLDISNDNPKT